jgi:transposase-like protein
MNHPWENKDVVFKTRVVLRAMRNEQTVEEIALEYGVPAAQVLEWKKQVIDQLPEIFSDKRSRRRRSLSDSAL